MFVKIGMKFGWPFPRFRGDGGPIFDVKPMRGTIPARLSLGVEQFMITPGKRIEVGQAVCIDRETGKLRLASEQDSNWFRVPPEARQEDGYLIIPEKSS